jgi:hypothetical protein
MTRVGDRLGVFAIALLILLAIVGGAFAAGYVIGKMFL